MAFKSIAVFVDILLTSSARIRYSVDLARKHRAHLIVIFVCPSGLGKEPADSFARSHDAIHAMIERYKAEVDFAYDAASPILEGAAARAEISLEFRVILEEDLHDQNNISILHVDLVVIGSFGNDGPPKFLSAGSSLFTAGVPFVRVPDNWAEPADETVGRCIMVCWNETREARRAIVDSLSLLIGAQAVLIIVVDAEQNGKYGDEPGVDIALFLMRHSVNATVVQLRTGSQSIGEVLLQQAILADADLIVLGAYNRGQTLEAILGGTTRFLFEHSSIPLFVSH